jgi:hypothetical protein
MILALASAVIPCACWMTPALAQQGETSPGQNMGSAPVRARGVQIYSVTAFAGYYSRGMGTGSVWQSESQPALTAAGGAVSAGWASFRERSSTSLTYTGTVIESPQYRNLSSLNHSGIFSAVNKLTSRWTSTFSLRGAMSTTEQFLFAPSAFSEVMASPFTFDDLAAAMLRGEFTNSQLAGLLTGTPLWQNSARTLLYGDRALTVSAAATFAYAMSSRTSLRFSAGAFRNDLIPSSGPVRPSNYLLRASTSADASVGISHSLTRRTQVSLTASTNRSFSQYQDAYANYVDASVGRSIRRRWMVQAHGGAGFATAAGTRARTLPGPQYAAGGGVAFQAGRHSFMGAVDRSFVDANAIGAGSTVAASGSWSWVSRQGAWRTSASYGQNFYQDSRFGNLYGGRVSAGLGRRLSAHTSVNIDFTLMRFSAVAASISTQNQSGVRMAFVWTPQPLAVR